jgi:hypothetical protein
VGFGFAVDRENWVQIAVNCLGVEAIARIFVGFEDFVGFSGSAFWDLSACFEGKPASQPASHGGL